ncbi:MAG TPA: dephospho-CoA kinase [Thermodesulfovibrionales bacterium]|nr:dephospho-CoA kinase [Thermodesulfovibrionales bacterium]
MLKVGLTGNYGMGKSTVSEMFRQLGAVIIDSDRIVASLLKEESVKRKLMRIVGVDLITPAGSIDKKYMAKKIFNNKVMRSQVEALLHPLVLLKVGEFVKQVRGRNRIVIVEVPLLFEGGYQGQFDRTITVFTDRTTALSRLNRSGICRKDAIARLQSQMDIRTKKRLADYCIDNSGTKRHTVSQVKRLYDMFAEESSDRLNKGRRLS